MNSQRTVIHWFRKGQRVHDNPALTKACNLVCDTQNTYVLRGIFILDPEILKWMSVGPNRYRFLQESLVQLNENLQKINSRLYVVRGNPNEVFPRIFDEWNVCCLTFETDIEPYAKRRDAEIVKLASTKDIKVIAENSHTIFDPEIVLKKNSGTPPLRMQKFLSIIAKLQAPEPYPIPNRLPTNSQPFNDSEEERNPRCYDPPALEELVTDVSKLGPTKYPGGESEALARMESYLKQTEWICSFEKPKTYPNSLEPSTTVLSPYLKFGCLSSRLFYKRLQAILSKNPNHSKPPVSLVGQLMWREFYYTAASSEPNFDKMVGNKICYQIPWQKNDVYLKAWTFGKTGYPFIDAIMRQLRQEGWIHHLARQAVACFLTRGDLWISWEEGQKVFEELLLDADWALNAGNWMWLSASAFFYHYFRVYSPIVFGRKTDPDGIYIKKYVPELKNYPSDIIYEPWKATLECQREYGCVLGTDYPHRIVIHEIVCKENLKKMSEAYKMNKEVRDNKVNTKEKQFSNIDETTTVKEKRQTSSNNKKKNVIKLEENSSSEEDEIGIMDEPPSYSNTGRPKRKCTMINSAKSENERRTKKS